MSQRLYELYESELRFIREEIRDFSGRFEKVAARLRMTPDADELTEDPHVSRLIDSFALLTSRLRLKLEDEFPEICQAMLSVLYPQYLAPTPSAAIVQLQVDHVGAEVASGISVARGALLETEEISGQTCYYRTCFPTRIQPFRVRKSEYLKPPFVFKTEKSWGDRVQAALRIEFESVSDKLDWSKTSVNGVRLYLGGTATCGNRLYETISRDALGVGWFSEKQPNGFFYGPDLISCTGFDTDQGLLDHDPRTQAAYRTLWEFFVLAEKFRFVDVRTADAWKALAGNQLTLILFLGRHHPQLQKSMSSDAIQLGCVPVVNLFPKDAEPIQMTESQSEYRIVPSYRTVDGLEVHSVQKVVATRSGGESDLQFLPFYEPAHRFAAGEQDRYWHASRRKRMAGNESGDRGTEVFLSIVDLHSRPAPEDDWILHVETVCCNRDLVNDLGMQTPLHFHGGPVLASFRTSPTQTLRPVEREDWIWRLISHLSLNHLCVASDSEGKLLREMLHLYNSQDREEVRNAIEGILRVRYSRSTARLRDTGKGPGICRGLDIEIDVDEERLEAFGTYLFASVLDRFFAQLASINSFTRLRVRTRSGSQIIYQGPARCGTKSLL
jgi:type VI secretion system protein ImpG